VWFKCEFLQHCGVFKTRGAFNRQIAALETGEISDAGIVFASGGNAGLAQAFVARELGIRATVFVTLAAPEVRVDVIQTYGAEVPRVGAEYAEAHQAATAFAQESGTASAQAYDQPEVAAGAGTIGEEILQDEPAISTIVVSVGGGGLRGCPRCGSPARSGRSGRAGALPHLEHSHDRRAPGRCLGVRCGGGRAGRATNRRVRPRCAGG